MSCMEVGAFHRDAPQLPRKQLTFKRIESGRYGGPGIHLSWDNDIPHLNTRPGGARYRFATTIRRALDR